MALPPSRRNVRGLASVSLLAVVAVLLALPTASAGAVADHSSPGAARTPQTLFEASAAWNGADLSTASTVGSAFTLDTGQQARVNFSYSTGGTGQAITTARLVVYYFGTQISANTVPASSGQAEMNWTLGSYTYLLQGVYQLTASLVAANGTSVWSENFYIHAQAPYRIGSGMTVFLLVLGAVEIWAIASSGGRTKRKKRSAPPPPTPWQPTPPPADAGAASAPATPPSPPPSPPSEGSP